VTAVVRSWVDSVRVNARRGELLRRSLGNAGVGGRDVDRDEFCPQSRSASSRRRRHRTSP
jgi:hypothetical protein